MGSKKRYVRMKPLKRSRQKRHTHSVASGLEDAIAVSLDLARETEDSLLILRQRINDLWEILKQLRAGPNNYNADRPAGRKPKRRFDE